MGGGLPPIAVDQLQILSLTHCYRGQAPSHILISTGRVIGSDAERLHSCIELPT